MMCTIIWGSIVIFPLFFMCCDWWKKCTYAAYEIPERTYSSLSRLLRGSSIRNVTLNVTDNTFDGQKANTLYEIISSSQLNGFTFRNMAGPYDFNGR